MAAIIADGTLTSLTVDGVPWLSAGAGATSGAAFEAGLRAAMAANVFYNWFNGDFTLTAPIVIDITSSFYNLGFDGHGARISNGFSDSAADMLTFRAPITNPTTSIRGLNIRNVQFDGQANCRNGLVVECINGASNIFGSTFSNVRVSGFQHSGILLYGNVFEWDFVTCYGENCDFACVELRNPTAGGGNGIISSIKFFGGDYRGSEYGIASTADTTYQEASGFHVIGCDFIGNQQPGILASSGCALVFATHLEANNRAASPVSRAEIYSFDGPVNMINCDGVNDTGSTNYLLEVYMSGGQSMTVQNCSMGIEGGASAAKLIKTNGSGTIYIDGASGATSGLFDGAGTTTIKTQTYATTTV